MRLASRPASLAVVLLLAACRDGAPPSWRSSASPAGSAAPPPSPPVATAQGGDAGACPSQDPLPCVERAMELVGAGAKAEGHALLRRVCAERDAGCNLVADAVEQGDIVVAEGERLQVLADARARSCQQAVEECHRYAALHARGARARGAFTAMRAHVARCEASMMDASGTGRGCIFASAAHAFGLGVPKDDARAKEAYARHCQDPLMRPDERSARAMPADWR